jgi:hypothetical protein
VGALLGGEVEGFEVRADGVFGVHALPVGPVFRPVA